MRAVTKCPNSNTRTIQNLKRNTNVKKQQAKSLTTSIAMKNNYKKHPGVKSTMADFRRVSFKPARSIKKIPLLTPFARLQDLGGARKSQFFPM